MADEIKDACGLFGVWGHPGSVEKTYLGLYALQHRGQESAGITSVKGGRLQSHKGMGLVADVFTRETIEKLQSTSAIGHVRYSTTGSSNLVNTQPLVAETIYGPVAVAHNGNLVNSARLRREHETAGSIYQTTTDSEVILHLLANPQISKGKLSILNCLREISGAYSLLFLTPTGMVAVRDPNGFRPLCLGKFNGAYVVASETCAFDLARVEYIRDIEPGEILHISDSGMMSEWIVPRGSVTPSFCIFEHVYFSRPDSCVNGDTVHLVRRKLGKQLAVEHPVQADVVIAIPDSGNSAAVGFAEESGIPYDRGFIRNHYVGRTFIQPSQDQRDLGVEIKLNVVKDVVRGKRVVVVDDSIIRGTTSKSRVRNLRDAGAREVHMRISCPPTISPCFYGIDFPTEKELIAATMDVDSIRKHLGLDSLGYLSVEGMLRATSKPADHFCTACFTKKYPVPVGNGLNKQILEKV